MKLNWCEPPDFWSINSMKREQPSCKSCRHDTCTHPLQDPTARNIGLNHPCFLFIWTHPKPFKKTLKKASWSRGFSRTPLKPFVLLAPLGLPPVVLTKDFPDISPGRMCIVQWLPRWVVPSWIYHWLVKVGVGMGVPSEIGRINRAYIIIYITQFYDGGAGVTKMIW